MSAHPSGIYIGLMSGTSLDGVDGVLADLSGPRPQLLAHAFRPLDETLRQEFLALNTSSGLNELHRAALAANALARLYAEVVAILLDKGRLHARDVRAIGAHGQTVRHCPQAHDATGYTIQLNQPALLAELTGISVVADFRSRDVAAAGQGAPLVPAFHQHVFARAGQTVAVLNVGGMANISVLNADGSITGFDCGPGNVLLDAWCRQHRQQPFDENGAWAASGQVAQPLLRAMLQEPFFQQPAPKSTGRELFSMAWLNAMLPKFAPPEPRDVQATLLELTATTCTAAIRSAAPQASRLIVCGGGGRNTFLMQRLQALLPYIPVTDAQTCGLDVMHVEATAFAWLAQQAVHGRCSSLPAVTGARGARILGAIWPA